MLLGASGLHVTESGGLPWRWAGEGPRYEAVLRCRLGWHQWDTWHVWRVETDRNCQPRPIFRRGCLKCFCWQRAEVRG